MSEKVNYVQWGGLLDLEALDDDEEEKIVETMREAGIRVGEAPAESSYYVRAHDHDE